MIVIICYPDAISNHIQELLKKINKQEKEKDYHENIWGTKTKTNYDMDEDIEYDNNYINNNNIWDQKSKTIIYYFDSMGCNNPRCIEIIKQYLICEYVNKFGNAYLKQQIENNKYLREIIDSCIEEVYPTVCL